MGVPKEKRLVTPAALRKYSKALRSLADTHDLLAQTIENAGLSGVDAMSMKTGVDGLVRIGKFLGAVTTAYCDNISIEGVGDIAGAVLELQRLTLRLKAETTDSVSGGDDGGDDDESIAQKAVKRSDQLVESKKRPRRK